MNKISVELLGSWGTDRDIAEAAWVSTGTDKRNEDDVKRVVNMLADLKHGVPFEAVHLRFYIKCPRYIETQIVKHRISSINGASARYRKVRTGWLDLPTDVEFTLTPDLVGDYDSVCLQANEFYVSALEHVRNIYGTNSKEYKRVKEAARGALPQAQLTELHVTMNLRSFANFYRQRSAPDAQLEIQQIAEQMLLLMIGAGVAPIARDALEGNDWII